MFCKTTKHSSCAKQKLYKMHTSTQSIFVQFCLEQEKCGCSYMKSFTPQNDHKKLPSQQRRERSRRFIISVLISREKPLSSRPAPSPQSTKCSATHSNPASCPSCTVLVPNHFKFGTKKVGASSFPSFTFHRKTFFLQQRSFDPLTIFLRPNGPITDVTRAPQREVPHCGTASTLTTGRWVPSWPCTSIACTFFIIGQRHQQTPTITVMKRKKATRAHNDRPCTPELDRSATQDFTVQHPGRAATVDEASRAFFRK